MTQQERSRKARGKWQRLVSEQARSGQSVAAFCRERKLCAPHFYWWKNNDDVLQLFKNSRKSLGTLNALRGAGFGGKGYHSE